MDTHAPPLHDELDDLLARMPEATRALILDHLAAVPPGPHTHRAACDAARILSAGLTPDAFLGLVMRMAGRLERQGDDVAEATLGAIQRHDIAAEAGAVSAAVRAGSAAERDAAIRAAWKKLPEALSGRARAEILKRRHGWSRATIQRAMKGGA